MQYPLVTLPRVQGYLRISVAADKDVTMVRQRRAEVTSVWGQFDDIQSIRAELSQVDQRPCVDPSHLLMSPRFNHLSSSCASLTPFHPPT